MGSPKPVLREADIPKEVVIPLQQGFGKEVPSVVKPGEKVRAGQIIGIEDTSCSSPIHATVNGIVKDMRVIKRFDHEMHAVVIKSDGSRCWSKMDSAPTNLENSDPDGISKMLYTSGFASIGRFGFPTRYNTSPLQPDDVNSLIINAVYSEPFAMSNEILLAGNVDKFLKGIYILKRVLPGDVEVYIGIDDRDKEIISEIETAAKWLHVHPLKPKYPQDHDIILIQTILGKQIPYGGSAPDAQVVVLDVQSVIHAYEAVVEGKPVIERIIALGGAGLNENLFLKVRVGTPLKNILAPRIKQHTEKRYICGGIITGKACSDLSIPVDRTLSSIGVIEENRNRQFLSFLRPGINRDSFSNAFLSSLFPLAQRKIDANENGEHRPCIYCNYCENVCPMGLMPYLLSKYVTHDMIEEADEHKILACIDCGLCTYVCPSKIPLMAHIQEGKTQLRENNS